VVTTTTQETEELFRKAAAGTREIINTTDVVGEEVLDFAVTVLGLVIKTVVPALKLVDKPIEVVGLIATASNQESTTRGVLLETDEVVFLLTRDGGKFYSLRPDAPRTQFQRLYGGNVKEVVTNYGRSTGRAAVQRVLLLIEKVKEVFEQAMAANEKRHREMEDLRSKLATVEAVLKPGSAEES